MTTTQQVSVTEAMSNDTSPENVPLPTDSMITVRLSDAELQTEPIPADDSASVSYANTVVSEQDAHHSTTSSVSRSSSHSSRRSSLSSSAANSVDWEGLEKTEEQEVKDDATDEVS